MEDISDSESEFPFLWVLCMFFATCYSSYIKLVIIKINNIRLTLIFVLDSVCCNRALLFQSHPRNKLLIMQTLILPQTTYFLFVKDL